MSREEFLGSYFLTMQLVMCSKCAIMTRYWMPRSFATFNPFHKAVASTTLFVTNPSPLAYVSINYPLGSENHAHSCLPTNY